MKLNEIVTLTEATKTVKQLQDELDIIKSKYSAWRRDNSIKSNTEIPPHLANTLRKFVDNIAAINEQIKTAKENERTSEEKQDAVKFNQKVAARHDNKDEKAERLGNAQREGSSAARDWVKKHGGYKGAAKALISIAKKQTNDGQEPFDAQTVADEIGITKGSILRWINTRGEFNGMKRFTGK